MNDSVSIFKGFVSILAIPFTIFISLISPQKPQIYPGSMDNYSPAPQEISTPVKNNSTSPMSGLEMTETGYQTTDKQISITPPPMVQTTTVNSNPKIDCVGPDEKHFQATQKECDDFNSAWKKPQSVTCQIVPGQSISVGSQEECNRAKTTFPGTSSNLQQPQTSKVPVYLVSLSATYYCMPEAVDALKSADTALQNEHKAWGDCFEKRNNENSQCKSNCAGESSCFELCSNVYNISFCDTYGKQEFNGLNALIEKYCKT